MTWWSRIIRRNQLEHELDAELREHFDRLVADQVAAGHTETEAKRLARLEFGGLDQVKEACRDERGTRWLDETVQDVRHGLRGFGKNPSFTLVAIVTLALGVGANLAIFNLVDALLLRPLPVPAVAKLITLTRWMQNNSSEHFSYPQIIALADRSDLFASLCGIGSDVTHVGPPEALQPVGSAWVSGRYFETLGLTPFAGRLLGRADDRPGAPPAVVLTYAYWQREFGGDRSAVGRTMLIEGQQVPIVGITPKGFAGATIGETSDLTLAIQARPTLQPENSGFTSASARWLRVLATPAASLTHQQLQSRLDVAWAQLLQDTTPTTMTPEARQRALSMTLKVESGATGTSRLRRELRVSLSVAMALVTLVLLIACVNVANLLLARGATRSREIALRLAIGASRGRIVRQLLAESALLATVGTTLGLLLAWMGSTALLGLIGEAAGPDATIAFLDVAPNWRIAGVTAIVVAATTLLFGMAPAWRASATRPASVSSSSRAFESHGRLAATLIVAQVSLSLVLVIGAGLFGRSLHNLRSLDRGFTAEGVVLASFDPTRAQLASPELVRFNQSVLQTVEALPGVRSASIAAVTPLQGGGMSTPMTINGVSTGENEIYFNVIGPRFFQIVGTAIVAGRDFAATDEATAPAVTIVNEALVREYLGGGNPVGQRVLYPGGKRQMQIVGVVKDAVYETLRAPAPPTVYMPYLQGRGRPMTLVIDASGPVADVASTVRRAIQPRVPATPMRIRTFAAQIESSLFAERLMMLLTTIFGVLALLLAAVGLYGLISYTVATRTREIGVRLALGARPARVVSMVLGNALRMVTIGVFIGLPAAWLLSRLISRLVFGLSSTDVVTMAAAAALLALVGVVSAALPARRAALVDPVTSIHVE